MTFHLKASSEVDRQRWVTALELAKSKAINMIESGEHTNDLCSAICALLSANNLDQQKCLKFNML